MHVRVVRFTDVDLERVERLVAQINEIGRPPEGIRTSGLQMIVDADQRTAVVLQLFDTAEDMSDSEAVFDAMDPSETPGTRASIDRGEVKLDLKEPA